MMYRCAVLFLAIVVCNAASIVKRQAAPKVVEFCKGSKSIVVDIDENVSGIVRSSNFSVSNYKNNTRCNIVFKTQSKPLQITIFFKSFDVEYQNTSCSFDKLCINKVNFCGNWTAGRSFDYVVPANQTFTLNFMTDLQFTAPGFELNLTTKAYNGSTISSPSSGVGSDFSKLIFTAVNSSSLSSYADKCKQVIDASLSYYMFQSPNVSDAPWITTTTTARPLNATLLASNTTTVKPLNVTTVAPSNTTTAKPANTTATPINTTTTAAPANTTAAPINTTTTAKPANTTAAPANTTAAPINTTTTAKPANTTAAPINTTTTAKPANTTAAPANTTAAPINTTTTAKPANTTAAPANTTAAPINTTTTAKPANTTAAPANTTAALINTTTTAKPANTTAAPINTTTTAKPANTTAAPVNTTATTTTAKPANTTQALGKRLFVTSGLYTIDPDLFKYINLPMNTIDPNLFKYINLPKNTIDPDLFKYINLPRNTIDPDLFKYTKLPRFTYPQDDILIHPSSEKYPYLELERKFKRKENHLKK